MDIWTILWLAWLGLFAVIEGVALVRSDRGDTLSEHVWKWIGVGRHGQEKPKVTGSVKVRRVALVSFMVWLTLHFLTGGWI